MTDPTAIIIFSTPGPLAAAAFLWARKQEIATTRKGVIWLALWCGVVSPFIWALFTHQFTTGVDPHLWETILIQMVYSLSASFVAAAPLPKIKPPTVPEPPKEPTP